MGRPKGNMALAALIDVHNNLGPLDTRQVVKSKSDLIADIWEGYAYKGMLVVVADEGKAYVLNDLTKIRSNNYSGWTELATSSSAAAAASVVQAANGQDSYITISTTEDPTDGHKTYTVSLSPVTDISTATSAANTGLADAAGVKTYVDNVKTDLETTLEEAEEVTAAALNDLNDRVDDVSSDSVVSIAVSTPTGVAKRYTVTQAGSTIGMIDIPKDLVVDEGKVVDVTYNKSDGHYYDGQNNIDSYLDITHSQEAGDLAGKYIRLKIANSQTPYIYIAAKDLVDIYTAGNGISVDSNSIAISLDSTNSNGLSVGSSGLALSTVVASTTTGGVTTPGSNGAMTAAQAEKLNGIATGAQVNAIEHIQMNGADLTIDANKRVDLGNVATTERVDKVEKVTAAALNDLDSRITSTGQASTKTFLYEPSAAEYTAKHATIGAATHLCGLWPLVQVYYGMEQVNADVTLATSAGTNGHAVTVSWEIDAPGTTQANKIHIRIVGLVVED